MRHVRYFGRRAEEWLSDGQPASLPFDEELSGTAPRVQAYLEQVLTPYAALWAECALAAAIACIYERLALRRIFFHTFESATRSGPRASIR